MEVSVIVCNYNQDKYLEKCLDSLNNQNFNKEYEIVFVDDCSTDGSRFIYEKYRANYKFNILLQEINKGLSSSRNMGLKNAKGKYICFVDSDDFVGNDFVSSLYKAIEENNVDCVIANFYGIDEQEQIISYEKNILSLKEPSYIQILNQKISTVVWDKIYKKEIIDTNKILFDDGKINEDILFNLRYLIKASRIFYIDKSIVYYRQNSSSITKKYSKKIIYDMLYVWDSIKKIFVENNLSTNKEFIKAIDSFYIYFIVLIGLKRIKNMKDKAEQKECLDITKQYTRNYLTIFKILGSDFNIKRKLIALAFLLYSQMVRI